MQPTSMTMFWIYIRIALILIILAAILAAVMQSLSLDGLRIFNSIFQFVQ